MKKIKVFVCLLMIVFISVFCCSCGEPSEWDELVRCLNERDKEGIMELFCESVGSSPHIDFEQQISDVFDLMGDRTITSYRVKRGSEQGSYEKGKKTWHIQTNSIKKIELSDGSDEIDRIIYSTTLVNEENPRRVGLAWIKIVTDEDEEYWIGEEVD